MAMVGITGYGAYLPRLRLQRDAVAAANAWFDASLRTLAKGERTMCNWDEDAITMAVEACTDCMGPAPRRTPAALVMASTSMPFLDRQNSIVVAEALNLDTAGLRTMDVTGSQRAGTSGLLAALDTAVAARGEAVLVASEHRRTLCASREEMLYGDGAAAVTVGGDNLLAELIASRSDAVDFVDHYRSEGTFDYGWEERWIRDEGLMKLVPATASALLDTAGVAPAQIRHFIVGTDQDRVPAALAKKLGIESDAVADNLGRQVGVTGAAHPILLLAHRLEQAKPGELILLVGFGQGCDALLFRASERIAQRRPAQGVTGNLARGRKEGSYNKFQSFNDLLQQDFGKRSEVDKQAYLTALYRDRGFITSFKGGKCRACGTVQLPKHNYCVNPECSAYDTQDEYPMSGRTGRVTTWTADHLTFDFSPPAYFGMITFEGGGRLMMDLTEVDPATFDTNTEVSVHFRVKQIDRNRGFRKYFWKAIPR